MTTVDYTAAADFYASRTSRKSRRLHYRRFASAAEAVEVDEQRFEGADILALYKHRSFPLTRRKAS